MSYDLQVFSQQALSVDDLRELVSAAGLGCEDAAANGHSLTVTRGAGSRYSFTLGVAEPVEAEDVPDEVTAVMLAPTCLYHLMVEGSSSTEITHAVRFARRLAAASEGTVLDQQTDQTWHRGKLRTSEPVERGSIATVELSWYTSSDDTSGAAARAWLELARRYLPEALPRRFGPTEPLAMKLDTHGPEAFVSAVAAEDWAVSFKASAPCIEGDIAGAAGRRLRSHSLSVHRGPLENPSWRDALQRLFVEFATRTDAFFASAEVQRGVDWSGLGTTITGETERTTYLAPGGEWAGLLPYPAWWTWFGPDYVPLVVDHLPADTVPVGSGLFHSHGAAPLDRDQLLAAGPGPQPEERGLLARLSRRGGASSQPAGPAWLPDDLLATVADSDPDVFNPPLIPARTMPPGLGALT